MRGRGQDSGEEGESGVAAGAVAWCSGCDVCAALNVSSSFRHPIHAAHLLEERDARIHAKQSPVALLDSNSIPTDAGKVCRPWQIVILEGASTDLTPFDLIGDISQRETRVG